MSLALRNRAFLNAVDFREEEEAEDASGSGDVQSVVVVHHNGSLVILSPKISKA